MGPINKDAKDLNPSLDTRVAVLDNRLANVEDTLVRFRRTPARIKRVLQNEMEKLGQSLDHRFIKSSQDLESKLLNCRELQTARCEKLRAAVPTPAPEKKTDWDLAWLKPAVIGLAILGALIGGVYSGAQKPPNDPPAVTAPSK